MTMTLRGKVTETSMTADEKGSGLKINIDLFGAEGKASSVNGWVLITITPRYPDTLLCPKAGSIVAVKVEYAAATLAE